MRKKPRRVLSFVVTALMAVSLTLQPMTQAFAAGGGALLL